MTDNATYSNKPSGIPSGTTIATDDIDGAHYQRVKLDIGGDGVSSPVTDLATSAKQDSVIAALQPPVTTSTVYNKTLTSADTEYSQALPANTRQFRFKCRTSFDVRFAFVADKVATPTAPYLTLPADCSYSADNTNLASITLYLAADEAGVIVEIETWA